MRTKKNLGFGNGFGFETQAHTHKSISSGFETQNLYSETHKIWVSNPNPYPYP